MKLAVDTYHVRLDHAGTKRVTVNLLEQFKKMPDIDLIELRPYYAPFRGKSIPGKLLGHALRLFWVHIHLPILCLFKKVDVLLSPEFYTPFHTLCKRIVIVHDAHMRAQKEFTNSLWFYCYYIPFIEYAIRKADLIFTVSEFAKKQIVELMRLDESKVYVAYNGIDSRFINDGKNIQLKEILRQGLVYKEYILFVGTFEARKNIEGLIEAFNIVKQNCGEDARKIKLAIIGKPATSNLSDRSSQVENLITRLHLKNEVVLCGFVSDEDLPNLYKGACMIAFPSLYEGFGLPIVEGFASGVPVLTSNVCSMPEIAGDAALLVDPYDVGDIAEKMEMILFDPKLRQELIQAGLKRANEFTWERSANKIVSEFKHMVS